MAKKRHYFVSKFIHIVFGKTYSLIYWEKVKKTIWISMYSANIAWNSCAIQMHHTSDTLYFKEYNLVIKHGLPLKLELTGFVDACPPKITIPCIYLNKWVILLFCQIVLLFDINVVLMLPLWPDVTIVQSDITIVVPCQLSTGSIHDYLFCYCPLVGILFEVLRIQHFHGLPSMYHIYFTSKCRFTRYKTPKLLKALIPLIIATCAQMCRYRILHADSMCYKN